ncbi:MAG: cytochrome c oxidase subunit II transmembrane domain-containing protein, partial [Dehalococcoidia bacterium]
MVIERLRRHRFLAIGLAISFLVILAACTPDDPQSTFGTAGPVAERQKDLFIIIFWVAVGVFVVVEGILVYAVIRFRRRRDQGIPKQTHGHTWLEIGWTIAPAIVLAIIAVPTIDAIFFTADAPSSFPVAVAPSGEELRVKVTAHQWWWEFEYFFQEELDKEKADLEKVKRGELD